MMVGMVVSTVVRTIVRKIFGMIIGIIVSMIASMIASILDIMLDSMTWGCELAYSSMVNHQFKVHIFILGALFNGSVLHWQLSSKLDHALDQNYWIHIVCPS